MPLCVVVVGASAGGIDGLLKIVRDLPAHFGAAVCVVVHVGPQAKSQLPEILARAGPLPARHAIDGEAMQAGTIYVAPPDFHLNVDHERLGLTHGPKVNNSRPSIDVLFRSAARTFGARAIGVILSGMLNDGASGLAAIKHFGGRTVVQDPHEAQFPEMPRAAAGGSQVDYVLGADAIGAMLCSMLRGGGMEKNSVGPKTNGEIEASHPSPFGCPDCGGVLWELEEDGSVRYRCRIGHAYSIEGLRAQQSVALENSLWAAVRALEEQTDLNRRLAIRARSQGAESTARAFDHESAQAGERAALVRDVVEKLYAPQAESVTLSSGSG